MLEFGIALEKTVFLASYSEARSAFLDIARRRSTRNAAEILDRAGGDGEELAIDMMTIGNPDAPKVLVIISGTHGLEGPPGSAVQRAFLETVELPSDDVRVVAIHGVNPWGFSHGSRGDQDNIDINRNFLDFRLPLPECDAYQGLHELLCPAVWSPDVRAELLDGVQSLAAVRGLDYVLNGLTAGQYVQPKGLNYGGIAPSWSNRALRKMVADELSSARRIAYVEWHTGYGRPGELFHVVLHPDGSEMLDRTASWWGHDAVRRNATAIEGSSGTAPDWHGLLLTAFPSMVPQADVAGGVIELGTYGNQDVLEGLMIDRWLRFGKTVRGVASREKLARRMREVFSPDDSDWREKVMHRAIEAQERALAGLASW